MVVTFLPAVSFVSFGLLTVDWLRSREESVRLLRSVRAERGRIALYLVKWAAVPFSVGGIFGAIVGLFLFSSKVLFVEGVNADPFFLIVFGFAGGLAGSVLGLVAGVVAEWRG
ncbi:MAG: hypothetical protein HYU39_07900 [Thaumarchaeota archaeon]|nr:hypothetical protein [Nitrososphaerota archaeon]